MAATDAADYPCSATFRGYFEEQDNPSPVKGEGRHTNTPEDLTGRMESLERATNRLYALSAMRSVEVAEISQRRHKPKY